MPASQGIAPSGLPRLQAMQYAILRTSIAMGTSSPDQVLTNFLDIAKGAGPVIGPLVTVTVPWAMLFTAFARYDWISARCTDMKKYAVSWLFASVSIPSSHTLHNQIQQWLVEQGLGANARSLTVASLFGVAQPNWAWPPPPPPPAGGRRGLVRSSSIDFQDSAPRYDGLSYVPEVGKYTFLFEGRRMTFERKVVAPVVAHEEFRDVDGRIRRKHHDESDIITITCFSPFSGVRPVQEFLSYVRDRALEASRGPSYTVIYRPKGYEWDGGIIRMKRTLDGIVLDGGIKELLVKDVDNYLRQATRVWYSNRGIPWRRGLLLYGPPGTGKTSFTTALAGHFALSIYIISLSSNVINDRKLERLFEQLPSRCILLLEDVDSAGIRRQGSTQDKKRKESRYSHRLAKPLRPAKYHHYAHEVREEHSDDDDDDDEEGITMSGLLNVLDGVHAVEGRITIMTSNHPDRLDPALIRPGRIDHKVLFGNASQEVAAKLFQHIFTKTEEEVLEDEDALGVEEIVRLSKMFASNIPAGLLTPAEVQGFLLVHRAAPLDAVEGAKRWADGLVKSKEMGSNVAAFDNDGRPAGVPLEDVGASVADWDVVRQQSEPLSRRRSPRSSASSQVDGTAFGPVGHDPDVCVES